MSKRWVIVVTLVCLLWGNSEISRAEIKQRESEWDSYKCYQSSTSIKSVKLESGGNVTLPVNSNSAYTFAKILDKKTNETDYVFNLEISDSEWMFFSKEDAKIKIGNGIYPLKYGYTEGKNFYPILYTIINFSVSKDIVETINNTSDSVFIRIVLDKYGAMIINVDNQVLNEWKQVISKSL